jgi:hypothetical protein
MATKYIVNNLTGQTINGDLTINGNVVITGTTNARKYEVYTALLTQSGSDDVQTFAWEYLDPTPEVPTLLAGVSYYIDSNNSNTDFTICGAPSNSGGTNFVANGVQPDWQPPFEIEGNYIQIEWNTGAPVTTVLENTIGNIWFTYDGVGYYQAKSNNVFLENKTFIIADKYRFTQSEWIRIIAFDTFRAGDNSIAIINATSPYPLETFIQEDNLLSAGDYNFYHIEIRVYN